MAFADRTALLLEGMPARRRVGSEIAWILALLYAPSAVPVSARMDTLLNGAFWLVLLGAGVTIAAPWRAWDEGRRPEAVAWVLILAVAVAAVVWSSHAPSLPRPRLGVVLVIGERTDGDPPGCGIAEVRSVVAGSSSDGVLRAADRICMVNGRALDPTAPVSDLVARLRGPGISSGPLALLVVRDGGLMEARIHLPDRPASPVSISARLLARALAVIGAVFVLVRAAGQSPAQLGLPRQGLLHEAAVGAPLLVATWMVHLAVSLPIVLLYAAVSGWRSIEAQAGDRVSVLTDLTGQVGSLPVMVVVGLTAAAFEEIAFRGFLLPRLGFVTGRWWIAIVLSSALFGLGHLYEGPVAVIQTAALGVWFCVVVLHRGRLVSTIVAHAAFNAMAVAALALLGSSGALDALKGAPFPGP